MTNIEEMNIGDRAEISGYNPGDKSYRRKLLSMGCVRGTVFTLSKVAPLGDPVEIEIRGFKLILRKAESNMLQIRKIE